MTAPIRVLTRLTSTKETSRMAMMHKLTQFARSPKGKQMMDRAQRMAKDPKTRRKIEEARSRIGKKRSGPGDSGHSGPQR